MPRDPSRPSTGNPYRAVLAKADERGPVTAPTAQPARRILAVVTILRERDRYAIDVTTPHGTTRDTAPTTGKAMLRAASIVAAMTDEEETT